MILPWSKEAKAIKLVKLQQQLYSDLKNMPISSIEEVAILEKENRDNQIDKLLIANHAIRNEFKELNLPKLPNAPGIVVPVTSINKLTYFNVFLDRPLTNYEEVINRPGYFSDELYFAAQRAHTNLIKAQLRKLSEQLGFPITSYNILRLVTEIRYKEPEQPVLVRSTYELPIPELEAVAKHFRSDIYIY